LTSRPGPLASLSEELAQYKSFLPNLPPKKDLLKVDPELRLAVCVPYKAGSETWRYLLGGETISNLQQVFSAHKAIQVREPYERLLSAYRFVFEDPAGLRNTDNIAAILREAFPHLPKAKTKRGEPTASFSQFIAGIVDGPHILSEEQQQILISGAALHWLPYHAQCPPCSPQIRPQSILKMETWLEDTQLLLNSTNLSNNGTFFLLNSSPGGHSSDPTLLRHYYSRIDKDALKKLSRLYQLDFKLFDYDPEFIFEIIED